VNWRQLGTDPNDASIVATRRQTLLQAWRAPVTDRDDFITAICRDRSVLDIGCVDHIVAGAVAARLHRRIASVADQCTGIDVNEAGARLLRKEGFDVVVADIAATAFGLGNRVKYDVVVAGELIEHLDNIGTFLENSKKMLSAGGVLVLSSPNPHSLSGNLRTLKYDTWENVDHVTYVFPSGMVELAERHGLSLRAWRGVECFVSRKRFVQHSLQWIARWKYPRSLLHCSHVIYELSNGP
jgi:SAM-dependent methyltransferase